MSVQKRRCLTCKHFDDARMSGNGWCTHPQRQVSSDVRILVRKGELACRNSWGGDLWASADSDQSAPDSAPMVSDRAFIANEHTEDRITSVRVTGADRPGTDSVVFSEPSFTDDEREDVIVDHASVSPENARRSVPPAAARDSSDDDGLNIPAQEDQQERARIIARGSRDAILRARERHTQRRKGLDRLQAPVRPDDEVTQSEVPHPGPADDEVSFRTTTASEQNAEDEVTIAATNPRFRHRTRPNDDVAIESNLGRNDSAQAARTYDDPTPPVPPEDVHHDPHNIVSRRSDRDRFESVPEIRPDIDLPRIREFLQAGEGSTPGSESPNDGDDDPAPLNSYDMVLRRAQAIKSASRAERQGRPGRPVRTTVATPRVSSPPVGPPDDGRGRTSKAHHLPSIEWDLEPENADLPFAHAQLPDLEPEEIVSGRQERREPEKGFEDIVTQTSWDDDEVWRDEDDANLDIGRRSYPDRTERDVHARSWWRSLNFGRGRRQPDHVHASEEVDEYELEDWSIPATGQAEFGDITTFDDDDLEIVTQQTPALGERSEIQADRPTNRGRRRQPAWEPLDEIDDDPNSTAAFHPTFSEQTRPTDAGHHPGARLTDRPVHDLGRARAIGFPLHDQQDMDAFRSALFGHEGEDRRFETVAAGRSRELEREPHYSQRQTALASPAREPRRSGFEPLDERPYQEGITETFPGGRWEEPGRNGAFDIRDVIEGRDDLLDMTIALAPDLPRMCQTCRDFRPSESGERGWCTNDWAFTHRQMVNAESLPCQSSIGCWWLPNDGSWLPALDPAERRAPTPRTDRLIARSRPDEAHVDRVHHGLYVREI